MESVNHEGPLGAKFYQSRDTARSLLGDLYSDRMQELGVMSSLDACYR